MGDILTQLQTYRAAGAIIRSFIRRALKQFSLGQNKTALNSMVRARQCYDIWMLDTQTDINERRKLQDPIVLLRDEILSFMKETRISPLFKARLWKNLPPNQQQMAYDELLPVYTRICESQEPPWLLRKAFSKPPGMEEFRKNDLQYRNPGRRKDVEQGKRYKP